MIVWMIGPSDPCECRGGSWKLVGFSKFQLLWNWDGKLTWEMTSIFPWDELRSGALPWDDPMGKSWKKCTFCIFWVVETLKGCILNIFQQKPDFSNDFITNHGTVSSPHTLQKFSTPSVLNNLTTIWGWKLWNITVHLLFLKRRYLLSLFLCI